MLDESPEMIELRMSETRDSLTQKINALENQVVDTLHNATSTVSDLLDSVKTVVPDTIHGVQDAVAEQVNTTFNVSKHTREKPWAMVGGAAALGFISGMLLFRRVYAATQKVAAVPQGVAGLPASPPVPVAPTPVKLPGWLDEIVDRLGTKLTQEVRRIGELAVDTASSSLQKTVETTLPRLFNPPVESEASRAERVANGFHPVPSHM